MRILVVGSGGREHALCWKIAASPLCDQLFCAPGNAGIAAEAQCVAIGAEDIEGLVTFAKQESIDFVVIGPEGPLVKGLADRLEAEGIAAFGPSAKAAALEGSKGFMKDLAAKYLIPSARYARFTETAPAKAFAKTFAPPIVIKADGLASGKGVVICASHAEAEAEIDAMLQEKKFGNASAEIVVEEFLDGEEVSFFALVDGTHALPLVSAQDHKRVGDGDTGPNTGGMGAYSPAPVATKEIEAAILERIIHPTVAGMAAEGRPFKGVLFAGIMVTQDGPKLIEFNCRFGDPETQPIMQRMKSDLLPALMAARDGALESFDLRWSDETALVVVMAAQGYPEKPQTGTLIRNLDAAAKVEGVTIFHAGTKRNAEAEIAASGGRVLGISATAKSLEEARARAYRAVDLIDWPGGFCRRDIGWRAVLRALEERLLSAEGRSSPQAIDRLLADDFQEIGSSGDIFGKREALDLLAEEARDGHSYVRTASDWSIRTLAADVALVTYKVVRQDRTEGSTAASVRSSIWKFRDGRWQMVFHQGTRLRSQ